LIRLVKSELLKLCTVRTSWALLLAGVALAFLVVAGLPPRGAESATALQDDDRADRHVLDALDRRYHRARRRRNWRLHPVVPVCAAQVRAEAPFRPSLTGKPKKRGSSVVGSTGEDDDHALVSGVGHRVLGARRMGACASASRSAGSTGNPALAEGERQHLFAETAPSGECLVRGEVTDTGTRVRTAATGAGCANCGHGPGVTGPAQGMTHVLVAGRATMLTTAIMMTAGCEGEMTSGASAATDPMGQAVKR